MSEPEQSPRDDPDDSRAAAAARIAHQQTWVDLQVRRAMERGDFDDLPGTGKPIEGLGETYDPEWWVKRLVERERITVLPASLQLRKDDAELDARLDGLSAEREVREQVEEFNARVLRARYGLPEGPPLITMTRDVEETVAAWRERRAARRTAAAVSTAEDGPRRSSGRRRWWRRVR
ncbi:DUF1992 domain-containing protein [Nocardioides sp. GY 10113]|uniref:DnaJ family domain-containing protein n=1 Tax=Nocardioides sp. GY 10113 TaxID=2569761 RepID=UPI0010A8B3BD|nr:DUF1992 domain-containing protein [Nocardioides sp. GY 10113]TIC83591.1 DUF1992 domain-containing protein [Nocardioides sp. GY 10113]